MAKVVHGEFKISTNVGRITISRGKDSVIFQPGEADKASQAVSTAIGCSQMRVLPPFIKCTPFKVKFSAGEDCWLIRNDDEDQLIRFTFKEGDELVEAIHMGLNKAVDEQKISGRARGRPYRGPSLPDPVSDI